MPEEEHLLVKSGLKGVPSLSSSWRSWKPPLTTACILHSSEAAAKPCASSLKCLSVFSSSGNSVTENAKRKKRGEEKNKWVKWAMSKTNKQSNGIRGGSRWAPLPYSAQGLSRLPTAKHWHSDVMGGQPRFGANTHLASSPSQLHLALRWVVLSLQMFKSLSLWQIRYI